MTIFHLLLSLALLALGGEILVRGASSVAKRLGMSPLLIGLTLVGFGTSTPELVSSVGAALSGSPGIAVGNVVGSNIANLLLVLGVTAAICPIPVSSRILEQDVRILIAVTAIFSFGVMVLPLGRLFGFALVAGLVWYVWNAWRSESNHAAPSTPSSAHAPGTAPADLFASIWPALALAAAGIGAVVVGGNLLVESASALARSWGVSDTVIGLTVVAVGTSLPEFVTSLVAAYRRQPDIALGNVLGSGVYNILGIAGLTGIISPVEVPADIIWGHGLAMLAATLVTGIFLKHDATLTRREGALLAFLYALYLIASVPR
jgi:cation:H+ antiporter